MAYDGNGSPFMKDGGNNHILDRSKVRILLCDNNEKSSQEVRRLLCKCSYQVTSVRTARQVIDALNAEGSLIDIILAEVDLPISKGWKMLKYVTRNKELHRIPIIMMSTQDEVSVIVKCLRLGAADYLVKPLRTNELLNLWTHMWRRRHMLGLAEKNILNYDFDLVASDPSDANTNSTTFLSDDTDDKSRKNTFPETSVLNQPEYMSKESATVEITIMNISGNHPNVADGQADVSLGNITSFPRKNELKVGENSAFFSYVKSKMPVSGNSPRLTSVNANIELPLDLDNDKNQVVSEQVQDLEIHHGRQAYNHNCTYQNNLLNDKNAAEVQTSKKVTSVSRPTKFQHGCNLSNDQWTASTHLHTSGEMNQVHKSGVPPFHFNMPFYFPQPMNHGIVQSTAHCYQASFDGVAKHSSSSLMPHYGGSIHPQYPHGHMHMMGSFAYYPPVPAGGQPGQVASNPQIWPPAVANTSSFDVKTVRIERREAALLKFRQKRKDRCFDKKIRYVNRKRLAERRPRVRGQFVRQTNGVNVDLNGRPAIDDDSEDEEDDDEEEEYASEY